MAKTKSMAEPDTRLLMQYLGVVTLLGRIARHLPKGDEDQYGLEKAIREANNYLLVTGSEIRYLRTVGGGYGAFTVDQLEKHNAKTEAKARPHNDGTRPRRPRNH
jgi:hypothetical protein